MKKFIEVAVALAILLVTASASLGQANNNAPPAGAILDLNGKPIPGGGNGTYQQYSVDFVAGIESTAITFAFRDDPAFISFINASVTDNAVSEGPNLLQNGDFSGGVHLNNGNNKTPNHWTYANQYGAGAGGVVESGAGFCYTPLFCWYDGAIQAYDAISQTISTTVGHTYHISFSVAEDSGCGSGGEFPVPCFFSEVSTNGNSDTGGNGINVTVYAQAGLPASQSSQTTTVQFNPSGGNPETQIAVIGDPNDPANQSLALTLSSVINAIKVTVTFFYEPTDISTGSHGVGIADGICENGATETQDFDCRLAGTFTFPDNGTLIPAGTTAGDRLVPHIIPSHNFMGVWVRVVATLLNDQPAVEGVDYTGPVSWYYAWNTNLTLAPGGFLNPGAPGAVNPEYPAGWNALNPQMYDRPGTNPDIAFVFNITTFLKNCAITTCVGTADPGVGGKTKTLNDIVIAAPPNAPVGSPVNTLELVVPSPGISTFSYSKALPMLVNFRIEDESTEISNPNAVTLPHAASVATLDFLTSANIQVQFPQGFPTALKYNPSSKTYYIYLSPAPYKTDGTKYTLQIVSDLLPQPVTATFVVKSH